MNSIMIFILSIWQMGRINSNYIHGFHPLETVSLCIQTFTR